MQLSEETEEEGRGKEEEGTRWKQGRKRRSVRAEGLKRKMEE